MEDGEIRKETFGRTLHVDPGYDPDTESHISEWFEQYYSIRFRNYPVGDNYLHNPEEIPT